ncbi:MAG: membrane dipeptidase [Gemmatimonadetes bacterium]|nr:MAG: membrane dipeptidase [Gemmatimonadota bacterium]
MGLPLGLLLMLQQPIIVDGHIDTPQRMLDMKADITARLEDGHVDVPRMREGGLTAAFFSIWVDARYGRGTAFQRAIDLIGAVRALADTNTEVELATTADQVRAAAARGHVAALMGVEGGHAIENSLEKLDSLYRLGVRYLTLTWNNGNDWAGSSTDPHHHGGLSPFGKRVVRRMNELGMLVDVSHVSDSTFWDVLAISSKPVIASRRRLKPETDAIRTRYRGHPGESAFEVDKFVGQHAESLDVPSIDRLLDHIDHAVQVMGVDHVALGSDFDGISVLPLPMKDATSLPELVRALEGRGYSDGDVRKILGENFLRLLTAGP